MKTMREISPLSLLKQIPQLQVENKTSLGNKIHQMILAQFCDIFLIENEHACKYTKPTPNRIYTQMFTHIQRKDISS